MKLRQIYKSLLENLRDLTLRPNISRSSGNSQNLVYLSHDRNYANAYANGRISDAHMGSRNITNGVLFYINLGDITESGKQHYGGDVWTSGFKEDYLNSLNDFLENSSFGLSGDVVDYIEACGYDIDEFSESDAEYFIDKFNKNDLSDIPILNWIYIQDDMQGYNEICVEKVDSSQIIKVEVYQNEELTKTINGLAGGDSDNDILYHGSPLKYWEKNLLS